MLKPLKFLLINTSINIIELDTIDSTNNYLSKLISTTNVTSGTVILAHEQTKGKGQRGNTWVTEPNKNLTFSMFLTNFHLLVEENFLISMAVANSIHKALSSIVTDVLIKWPNDILIHKKKVGGILIENTIQGKYINQTVIGIGINVNQTNFNDIDTATSLKLLTNREFDKKTLLLEICTNLIEEFSLINSATNNIREYYLSHLHGYKKPFHYRINDQNIIEGTIQQVDFDGKLHVLSNGKIIQFYFKEIEFVLNP